MTVCIAAIINWVYPPNNEIGRAIIAAADRMLTAGDVEYEPPHFKIGFLRKRIALLVAGDITVHTEALTETQRSLTANPSDDVEDVAGIYANAIRRIRDQRACDEYLSPLGLTQHSFVVQQKEMNAELVFQITNGLREYELNVDALVIGCDEKIGAFIFQIDGRGRKTFQHDITFAAIGIGANHAKSQFMFARYPRIINYYRALPILYSAKRRAEVAPGVGRDTDWLLITRVGMEVIHESLIAELDKAYAEYQAEVEVRLGELGERLAKVLAAAVKTDQSPAKDVDLKPGPEVKE